MMYTNDVYNGAKFHDFYNKMYTNEETERNFNKQKNKILTPKFQLWLELCWSLHELMCTTSFSVE